MKQVNETEKWHSAGQATGREKQRWPYLYRNLSPLYIPDQAAALDGHTTFKADRIEDHSMTMRGKVCVYNSDTRKLHHEFMYMYVYKELYICSRFVKHGEVINFKSVW